MCSYITALVLLAALCVNPSVSKAADFNSTYFIKEMIDVFASIKSSFEPKKHTVDISENPKLYFTEVMDSLITQRHALSKSAALIASYEKNKDKNIAAVATLYKTAILMLYMNLESNISLIETEILNKSQTEFLAAMGTTSRKIKELSLQNEDAWGLVVRTSISLQYAIIDDFDISNAANADMNKKLYMLKISKKELSELKTALITNFGNDVKKEANETTPNVNLPAKFMWQFLNGNWKTKE